MDLFDTPDIPPPPPTPPPAEARPTPGLEQIAAQRRRRLSMMDNRKSLIIDTGLATGTPSVPAPQSAAMGLRIPA